MSTFMVQDWPRIGGEARFNGAGRRSCGRTYTCFREKCSHQPYIFLCPQHRRSLLGLFRYQRELEPEILFLGRHSNPTAQHRNREQNLRTFTCHSFTRCTLSPRSSSFMSTTPEIIPWSASMSGRAENSPYRATNIPTTQRWNKPPSVDNVICCDFPSCTLS